MKSILKKYIVKYWLLFFFMIVFLVMGLFKIPAKKLYETLLSLRLWELAIVILVFALISVFQILSRKYLFKQLGEKPGIKNLTLIHFSSMAAHYSSPAKLGFPLAVYLFKKFENISYPIATAMILTELVISMGICGIIALGGSYFYFAKYQTIFLLTVLFLVILCLTIYFILRALGKKGQSGRIHQFAADTQDIFRNIPFRAAITYIVISTLIQILSGVNFFLLCYFFSIDVSLWKAIIISSSAFFLGAVSMVPMGLGVREGSVLFYLNYLGVASDISLSVITVNRLVSTGLTFLLGMIAGGILGAAKITMEGD